MGAKRISSDRAYIVRIETRNRRWFPNYHPSHEVYLEKARAHAGGGAVLHLGAGRDSLGVAGRLNADVVISVDRDVGGLARNRNRLRVAADGRCLPFRAEICTLVLSENVFEHLEEPEVVLRECHRVLVDRGAAVFLCPNRLSYVATVGRLTPHWFHVWFRGLLGHSASEDTFRTYYRLNSARRIRSLAAKAGFVPERLDSFVGWPTYWEFSDLAHRLAAVGHWLLERGPSIFHITLVGVLRKKERRVP